MRHLSFYKKIKLQKRLGINKIEIHENFVFKTLKNILFIKPQPKPYHQIYKQSINLSKKNTVSRECINQYTYRINKNDSVYFAPYADTLVLIINSNESSQKWIDQQVERTGLEKKTVIELLIREKLEQVKLKCKNHEEQDYDDNITAKNKFFDDIEKDLFFINVDLTNNSVLISFNHDNIKPDSGLTFKIIQDYFDDLAKESNNIIKETKISTTQVIATLNLKLIDINNLNDIKDFLNKSLSSDVIDDYSLNPTRGFIVFSIKVGNKCIKEILSLLEDSKFILNVIPCMIEVSTLITDIDQIPIPDKDQQKCIRYFLPDEFMLKVAAKSDYSSLCSRNQYFSEAILKFQSYLDSLDLDEEAKPTILMPQYSVGYFVVSVPQNHGLFKTIEKFNSLDTGYIEFAEPSEFASGSASLPSNVVSAKLISRETDNYFIKLIQNFSLFITKIFQKIKFAIYIEYAFENFDPFRCWGIHALDLYESWNISKGESEVVISVIDTLIRHRPQNFNEENRNDMLQAIPNGTTQLLPLHKVFLNANFSYIDFSTNNDFKKWQDHGDHVASIISGIDPYNGFIGTSPRCTLQSLGVNLEDGMIANRVDCIQYVLDQASFATNTHKKFIINCSWCVTGRTHALSTILEDKLKEFDNVLLVTAAGNEGTYLDKIKFDGHKIYPACIENNSNILVISGTDISNDSKGFNYGEDTIDIFAPGINVTVPNSNSSRYSYTDRSGTSLAAPYISGISALVWGVNRDLTASKVAKILKNSRYTYVNLGSPGITNAFKAIGTSLYEKLSRRKKYYNLNYYIRCIIFVLFLFFDKLVYFIYTLLLFTLPRRIRLISSFLIWLTGRPPYSHQIRRVQELEIIKGKQLNDIKIEQIITSRFNSRGEIGAYGIYEHAYCFIPAELYGSVSSVKKGDIIKTAKVELVDADRGIVVLSIID